MKHLEQLSLLFHAFHEAVYIVDQHRKILYFNPEASRISGFSQDETQGFFCYDNILNHVDENGKNLCLNGCPLVDAIKHSRVEDHQVYLHHKEGHRIKVHVRAIPYEEDGEIVGAIEVFTDQTEKNLMTEMLEVKDRMMMIDALTGLMNRKYFETHILNHKTILRNHTYAILFMDIDDFKKINDTYGHLYGDEVLKSVSKTILSHVRSNDQVIRFGGEEILCVLKDISTEQLISLTQLLLNMIRSSKPRKPDYDYHLSISIGATMFKSYENILVAIERADQAMYQAKKQGKDQVVIL